MLNYYYEHLEKELEQARAAIDYEKKCAAEAQRALDVAEKRVYDACVWAERIVRKQCRIEASEYAQRDIEIALYGVCVP